MNKVWSEYQLSDGLFTGRTVSRPAPPRSASDGCAFIIGDHDHLHSRIDIQSNSVVPHHSPKIEEIEKERQRRHVMAQIEQLERKQARRIRELLVSSDSFLKKIDDEILELRNSL